MTNDLNQKTKEEVLDLFIAQKGHNTLRSEQYNAAIIVKSASDIQTAARDIKDAVIEFKNVAENIGKSSDKLTEKLFWLNVVITFATLIGAIATAVMAFK
jgi:hypothetical protein